MVYAKGAKKNLCRLEINYCTMSCNGPPMMPRKFAWFFDGKDSTCTSRPSQCPPPIQLPEPDPCPVLPNMQPVVVPEKDEEPFVPSGATCETPCECPEEVYGYPTTGPAQFCMKVASEQCGGMDPRNPRWQRRFRNCMVGASGVAGQEVYYGQDEVEGTSTTEEAPSTANGADEGGDDSGSWFSDNWVWILVAVLVVAGIIGVVLVSRNRQLQKMLQRAIGK